MGVVFEIVSNADLFAYFPKTLTPIPKNPTSVWLLMYGGLTNNDIMTGGTMTTKDLEPWTGYTQHQINHQLLKEHPELKAGIEAASAPAR